MHKAIVVEERIRKELEVRIRRFCIRNAKKQNFQLPQNIPGQILITFDTWTSGTNDPYLAVTAHYIASPEGQANNWELRSKVLGYTDIEGNHSGANTAAVILQVVDRYGIRQKASVASVTVDLF